MDLFKLVGSIVIDSSGAEKDLDGVGGKLSKVTSGLGKMMGGVGKIAGAVGVFKIVDAGINMITGSVGSAISRFDTLENSQRVFENMGFEAGETKDMMDSLTDSITGLPTPMESAVEGVQRLSSATGDLEGSEEIYSSLNNAVLGFGGSNEEVDRTVQMFSRSLQSGKMNGDEFNTLMNNMGPVMNALAKEMGMTTQEMQKGLSDGSIDINDFTDDLIRMNEEGGGGLASLEQIARDSTEGIGTSIVNVQNAINRGMASILKSTNEALEDNGLPSIAGMITMVGEVAEATLGKVSEYIPVVIGWVAELVESFGGLKDMFTDGEGINLDGFIEGLAESMPAILEKGTEIVLNLIEGMVSRLPMLIEIASELIMGWLEGMGVMYPLIIESGLQIILSLMDGIFGAMPQLISSAGEILSTWVEVIFANIPLVISAGGEILANLAGGIISNAPQLIGVALQLIVTFLGGILSAMPQLIVSGGKLVLSMIQGIVSSLPQLIPVVRGLVDSFVSTVVTKLPDIVRTGISTLLSLIDGVVSAIPKLIVTALKIIVSLAGAILNNLPKIISVAIEIIVALAGGLIKAIPKLLGAVPTIFIALKNAFMNVNWGSVGKGIIDGIGAGLVNFAGGLVDKGKEVASQALGGIQKFLGINSPSRLFRDEVGKWIPAGIAVGIEDNSDLPLDALEKIIGIEGYDFSGVVGRGEQLGYGSSERENVEQNITINSPKHLNAIEASRQFKKASRQLALGI